MREDILAGLSPEQVKAVKAIRGYKRILGGPGTGKGKVLLHRLAYLLEEGQATGAELLCLVFHETNAAVMKRQLAALSPTISSQSILTFDQVCERILQEGLPAFGLQQFTLLSMEEEKALLQRLFETLHLEQEGHYFPRIWNEFQKRQVSGSQIWAWLQAPSSQLEKALSVQVPQQLYDHYQLAKKKRTFPRPERLVAPDLDDVGERPHPLSKMAIAFPLYHGR